MHQVLLATQLLSHLISDYTLLYFCECAIMAPITQIHIAGALDGGSPRRVVIRMGLGSLFACLTLS